MDLKDLNVNALCDTAHEMNLCHPVTGEKLFHEDGKPLLINVLGSESEQFRCCNSIISNRRVAKNVAITDKLSHQYLNTDDEISDIAASITVGWSGIVENGTELVFTKETALQLYRRQKWIAKQVFEFAGNIENFMKRT